MEGSSSKELFDDVAGSGVSLKAHAITQMRSNLVLRMPHRAVLGCRVTLMISLAHLLYADTLKNSDTYDNTASAADITLTVNQFDVTAGDIYGYTK